GRVGADAGMSELDTLIQLLARLPGLGPRSARRAALFLLKRREQVMQPLAAALGAAAAAIRRCATPRRSASSRILPICGRSNVPAPSAAATTCSAAPYRRLKGSAPTSST